MEQVSAFERAPLGQVAAGSIPDLALSARAKNTGADGPQGSIPGVALFAPDNRPAER